MSMGLRKSKSRETNGFQVEWNQNSSFLGSRESYHASKIENINEHSKTLPRVFF
jgi:hypothetical protein